ncbi:fatty acid--CoA ligase family protein [Amycolatopsis sp. NPDC021455]|uniref:class I adenylate-forming enzyme family protein n=1 Tax=Amycolatopsis sp. NPDC021455 TaxID=3154901 RepID=UPI00340AD98E
MTVLQAWWSGHAGYAARILARLAGDPGRTAVHWRGRAVSAGALADEVGRTARALRERGVGAGDMLGVLVAPNGPGTLSVRYAAHLLGASVCYLRSANAATTAAELSTGDRLDMALRISAKLVADAENEEGAALLSERSGGRIEVIRTAELPAGDPGRAAAWDPDAPAVVSLTSGSTGKPKGIRLSGRAWESRFTSTGASLTEGAGAKLLVATPLSHTAGPVADAVLAAGGTLVLHDEVRPAEVLRAVAEHGVTRMFVATPHLYELLDAYRREEPDIGSLQRLIYGGSPASPAKIAEAIEAFGPVLVQGYGTNESGPISCLTPADHGDPAALGTVGRPFPDVKVRVCRPGSGEELPPGEVGEVCVHSTHLMDGYWQDPERTAQVLDDGWYRTGDLGAFDAAGRLRLLDRIADVIKANGIKIYPTSVERVILAIPGVAQAAVYGVRDENRNEHVHAAIVAREGARVGADLVRARVTTALSALHAPEEVRLLDAMPLNHTGKPDKPQLRRTAPAGTSEGR